MNKRVWLLYSSIEENSMLGVIIFAHVLLEYYAGRNKHYIRIYIGIYGCT